MKIVKITEKGERIKQFDVKEQTVDLRSYPLDNKTTNSSSEVKDDRVASSSLTKDTPGLVSLSDMFYEIDYNASPIPGVGQYTLKSETVPEVDNIELINKFNEMRRIRPLEDTRRSNPSRTLNIYSNYYFESQVDSHQFYEQGKFMEDVTDVYPGIPPLFRYFPVYHGLSDNQLRRYFSWRTKVRNNDISYIEPSYAFLYVYEILANIGVKDPEEGLDILIRFWKNYSRHNSSLNRYLKRWIKDYYIFYRIPNSFASVVRKYDLKEEYPETINRVTEYDIFLSLSSYDVKKSKFYTADNIEIIEGSFCKVIDNLRIHFSQKEKQLFNILFEFENKMEWEPFKDAVFYKYSVEIPFAQVEFSKRETYIVKNNEWVLTKRDPSDSSKYFMGYIIKKMESELRKITDYKNKLYPSAKKIYTSYFARNRIDIDEIDNIIIHSINEYYREKNRVVVEVDMSSLTRIRTEAAETQEKLTVETPNELPLSVVQPQVSSSETVTESAFTNSNIEDIFTDSEKTALELMLKGSGIKEYAASIDIMLEVLVDNINEKAMDNYGDSFIDEEYMVYSEYQTIVKGLIK
ncbi:MAG: TerB N-terminal domain-containing protein [Oscillospiraceae bacterium]|nr:TerB N-terminal domain-containing protein [Oscillospiraceae bacterium]